MSDLRQAAQQALEALQLPCSRWNGTQSKIVDDAITALRAALAEPVQEPVGFDQLIAETEADPVMRQTLADGRHWVAEQFYTIPHQRKPLTEEEIDSIWDSEKAFADIYAIARAIERAHGIV